MVFAANHAGQAYAELKLLKLRFRGTGNHVGDFAHGINYVSIEFFRPFRQHDFRRRNSCIAPQAHDNHPLALAGKSDQSAYFVFGCSVHFERGLTPRQFTTQHRSENRCGSINERINELDFHNRTFWQERASDARHTRGYACSRLAISLTFQRLSLSLCVFFEFGLQRVLCERFRQVIGDAGLDRFHNASLFRFGGDHEDRHLRA